jgi:hypothetical protein
MFRTTCAKQYFLKTKDKYNSIFLKKSIICRVILKRPRYQLHLYAFQNELRQRIGIHLAQQRVSDMACTECDRVIYLSVNPLVRTQSKVSGALLTSNNHSKF